MIRAVVFDIGGVVLDTRQPETLALWDERCGLPPGGFLDAVYGDTDATVLVGTVRAEDHWEAVGARLGLPPGSAEQIRREVRAAERLDEELAQYIGSLRPRGYKTAFLSNAWSDARESHTRHGLATLVDEVVLSAEVGRAKPGPEIYLLTLERLGVEPGEAIFVDDVAANVAAAKVLGMVGVRHESTPATIAALEARLAAG